MVRSAYSAHTNLALVGASDPILDPSVFCGSRDPRPSAPFASLVQLVDLLTIIAIDVFDLYQCNPRLCALSRIIALHPDIALCRREKKELSKDGNLT